MLKAVGRYCIGKDERFVRKNSKKLISVYTVIDIRTVVTTEN